MRKLMILVIVVDNFVLSFFTKISHKFYKLTGRTNFFLAKLAMCLAVASIMIPIIGFWFPLLSSKLSVIAVIIFVFVSLILLRDMYNCDRAEANIFSSSRTKFFGSFSYSPNWRILWLIFAIFDVIKIFIIFFISSNQGIFLFKILNEMFGIDIMLFNYFISVDPPTPGKSKIREWAESFSAGFRKLVPIKAKN